GGEQVTALAKTFSGLLPPRAAMPIVGWHRTAGSPPFPLRDVTWGHSMPSGLARPQAWSSTRSRVWRLNCSSAAIRA
ncbi:MAG TPA: hypothetical protein VFZ51_04370, partial [Woeseiaceae bacterium]